jgi:hypothetical protein
MGASAGFSGKLKSVEKRTCPFADSVMPSAEVFSRTMFSKEPAWMPQNDRRILVYRSGLTLPSRLRPDNSGRKDTAFARDSGEAL